MHFAEFGDTLAEIPYTRDRSERSGWLSHGRAGVLSVRAFSPGASRDAPVENIRFGCNPGGRACQQVLRAKHLLTMPVFGCSVENWATQFCKAGAVPVVPAVPAVPAVPVVPAVRVRHSSPHYTIVTKPFAHVTHSSPHYTIVTKPFAHVTHFQLDDPDAMLTTNIIRTRLIASLS